MNIWISGILLLLYILTTLSPKLVNFLAISQTACVNKQMTKLMLNKAGNEDAHFVVSFHCPPERLRGEPAERCECRGKVSLQPTVAEGTGENDIQ